MASAASRRASLAAAGALIDYVSLTQVGRLPALQPLRRNCRSATSCSSMVRRAAISSSCARSSASGAAASSTTIDETVTGPGARLLAAQLAGPLTDVAAIRARLDAVAWFVGDKVLRQQVRAALVRMPDMTRAAGATRARPRRAARSWRPWARG